MFNRILVPLDGSPLAESILPHVTAFGRAALAALPHENGGKQESVQFFFLQVLDPHNAATRTRAVDPFEWHMRKAEAEAYLRQQTANFQKADGFSQAGLVVEGEVVEGRAADTIVDYAESHQVDLIALSSHGQSGISGWNVSSVVQKVMMRARRSVLLTRAYRGLKTDAEQGVYRRILLPLDGSARSEVVLPYAVALARQQDAKLLLVHVVRRPEIISRTPLSSEDQELISRLVERNRTEASRYLGELRSRLDARTDDRLLLSEHYAHTLHDLVEETETDLVILSAHGKTGGSRWPYGSTVVSFISYGTTPLLIVQDLPPDRLEPSQAELAARQQGGR